MRANVENLLCEEIEVAKRQQHDRAEAANLEYVKETSQINKEQTDEIPF